MSSCWQDRRWEAFELLADLTSPDQLEILILITFNNKTSFYTQSKCRWLSELQRLK